MKILYFLDKLFDTPCFKQSLQKQLIRTIVQKYLNYKLDLLFYKSIDYEIEKYKYSMLYPVITICEDESMDEYLRELIYQIYLLQ
jgi:hypothetical protein